MRPPLLGWALVCLGWLACGGIVGLAFKTGFIVGNQGAQHWRTEADSLRRLMREGICVRRPGMRGCDWMIARDTIRGTH